MNRRTFLKKGTAVGIAVATPGSAGLWAATGLPDYPLKAVSVRNVEITDAFWSPRIEAARTVSLPLLLDREKGARHIDSRLIEGASYFLIKEPDPTLQARVQSMFPPLNTSMRAQMGQWKNQGDGPFLGAGHFFEAAIAYRDATNDPQLMTLAIEVANDLDNQFGPGKRTDISNHEGIELALVKLYYATGDTRYARLAKFMVDVRGTTDGGRQITGSYAQDHEPVVAQRRAIGHCVRATYLYSAVTDLSALTPDGAYRQTIRGIWEDAVSKRTYLTGGIGSYRQHENFGDEYDLPNVSCWNEICAAVGNTLWNQRMFLLERDGRYIDVMERILYNGLLAGVSLKGDTFLYQTPLKTYPEFRRQAAFGPNCCPPNITRLLGQLGTLIYSNDTRNLYVNLFIGSKARFQMNGRQISLQQETKYPWEGATRLTVSTSSPTQFVLHVRVPGWARGEFDPGNLYRHEGANSGTFRLSVNGREFPARVQQGFATIDREWKDGDVVEFALPMDVRTVRADVRAVENKGMAALVRGPIVFCAEGVDNKDSAFNLILPESPKLEFSYDATLVGGVGTIHGPIELLNREGEHREITRNQAQLKAIPFYAFGNRTPSEMSVWLASDPARAVVAPAVTIASTSLATSSCGNGTVADNYPEHNPPATSKRMYPTSQDGSGSIAAISDGLIPVNSEDGSAPFLRLRPQSGSSAWVQYDFSDATEVSAVSVYWKDDKQFCAAPEKWTLLYRDGEKWKPVQSPSGYGVQKDTYNKTTFTPIRTNGLRLDINLSERIYKKGDLGPPDADYMKEDLSWYEGGVIEWAVEGTVPPASAVFSSFEAPADHALDPDPESEFWKPAESIVLSKNILGDPDPAVRSEARSRWTKNNLYFLFWGPYETLHLKPNPDTAHETLHLWFYDDFELYLGSNFENINLYGEFQISPQSEYLDNAIDATVQRPGWGDEHLWNSGMSVKSRIDHEKKIWYGEMCIPIAAVDKRKPAVGNEFRANVYRLQYAGEGKKVHFPAWQPTGEWNPHRPKKFGVLRLVPQPAHS